MRPRPAPPAETPASAGAVTERARQALYVLIVLSTLGTLAVCIARP
ncbi:hypothetical protein [Streptomyces sp. 2P-4]|nr:hypothetical protein [Streptomyces sp. 2P-4]